MKHYIYLTKENIEKLSSGEELKLFVCHEIKFNEEVIIKISDKEKIVTKD